ncbi:MAG: NUDIX hydrolase [Actinomycetes bacterium]
MRRSFPLPGHAAEVAARLGDPDAAPPTPRPAATVVLVRDGDRGVEVFLLRRRASMAFAAGMSVFPGGGVDPRDTADDVPWAGADADRWGAWLGCSPREARGYVCAAVRETFEECGVLLAGADATGPVCAVDAPEWEEERQRLLSRERAMSDVLRSRGLVLRADLLRPWAHWTTPVHEPRRYDTRFLLAVLPEGQQARHVGEESDESGWYAASDVVDLAAHGDVLLMPPTLVTLEEVAAAADTEALWAQPRRLREVLPVIERRGEALVVVADLPDQPPRAP